MIHATHSLFVERVENPIYDSRLKEWFVTVTAGPAPFTYTWCELASTAPRVGTSVAVQVRPHLPSQKLNEVFA